MDSLEFEFQYGGRIRRTSINSTTVVIGRSRKCDLVIPLPWVAERHIILQEDPPFLRAKVLDPSAQATIGKTPMGHGWQKLENNASIQIRGPGAESLNIRIQKSNPNRQTSMVKDKSADRPAANDFGFVIATDSALVGGGGWSAPIDDEMDLPPAAPLQAFVPDTRPLKSIKKPLGWTIAGVSAMIIAALAFSAHRASVRRTAMWTDSDTIHASLDNIARLCETRDYSAAKAELDKAQALANKWATLDTERHDLEVVAAKPEIVFGSKGFEFIEGQWLAPDKARLVHDIQARIEALQPQIVATFDARRFEDCDALCRQQAKLISESPMPEAVAAASKRVEQRLAQIKAQRDAAAQQAQPTPAAVEIPMIAPTTGPAAPVLASPASPTTIPAMVVRAPAAPLKAGTPTVPGSAAMLELAYSKGQEVIRAQLDRPDTAKFPQFPVRPDKDVYVAFRQGWYAVQMTVDFSDANGHAERKIARCKLRPKPGSTEWETWRWTLDVQ